MHHTSEPQNQGDRLKGWGIQYQPNITNYVTQTDPCCVGLLHETAALEDITKTIQQTANKEGAVICAHWSVRKTRRHIWYEDENGLGIVSYRPVGIRVGIQQCSLFNIPTRKDNTDGAGHTKLIRTIDAQKCSWKPIIGLMCFGCKRWWYVIPAETKACHLVYMESFFVSTASSSFSLPPRFSFTSANNICLTSLWGGCLSSHQGWEQRGGDGSGDSARQWYWSEPISGLHSWSSCFFPPLS